MLPKRLRRPCPSGMSSATPSIAAQPGKSVASSANWFAPRVPRSSGKLSDTSCRHSTSKSAIRRASATTRARSQRPSIPSPHWMFQVMSFIDLSASSANSGAHEALHELPLEEQEAEEEGSGGHERRSADDRPVDALVAGREHLQADGEGPRLDRVRDDERPKEVVPVIAHRDEAVGDVDRAGERHVDLEQHLKRARPFDARGVVELLRHGLERLAQEEDTEGRGDVG